MELTQCINYLLTTSQHTVFQFLSGKLSEYDLTPSQYGVLSCLWRENLQRRSRFPRFSVWKLDDFRCVGSYAKKGLIDRVINREDRREVRVVPTEKGKQLQEPITEIIDEVNEEVLKCFTEEEVTALKNALRIIADGSHFK